MPTGKDIQQIELGNRIIKSNSYSSTGFGKTFNDLENGKQTEYFKNRGLHMGYSRTFIRFSTKDYIHLQIEETTRALRKFPLREVSFPHPYTNKIITGNHLSNGKYTFAYRLSNNQERLLLEIKKDY